MCRSANCLLEANAHALRSLSCCVQCWACCVGAGNIKMTGLKNGTEFCYGLSPPASRKDAFGW
eukprot:scaffold20290_cov115-Skeletonema_dohrnii-CCMP3373.AAC.1